MTYKVSQEVLGCIYIYFFTNLKSRPVFRHNDVNYSIYNRKP